MRFGLEDFRALAEDATGAAYRGLSATRVNYLERRRLRGESERFRDAFQRSSFIAGWMGRNEAELLFELAAAVPPGQDIVEIGSYPGRSTVFLALGAQPGRTIHAVDPHTSGCLQLRKGESIDTSKYFLQNIAEMGVEDRVEPHITFSVDAAHTYTGRPVGLLFVDGNHSEKAVVDDGREWAVHMAPGCFVAFDDIAWTGVARGVDGLVSQGILPPVAGRVGKIGLCGPSKRWPERVRAIAQREPSARGARTFFRRFVSLPAAPVNGLGQQGGRSAS
jgi:MMP 1-O-methyltransferase